MFDFNRLLTLLPARPANAPSFDFTRMLNWKLLQGSHAFPGPDGGTCVNEAAIVVAGLPYRKVQSVEDLPASFSPPLANFAMGLNDSIADDALRQELLLPFVTRLAGSADAARVEARRTELIIRRIVTDLVPLALAAFGFEAEARSCRSAKALPKALAVVTCAIAAVQESPLDIDGRAALTEALSHVKKAIECHIEDDISRAYGIAAGVIWRLISALQLPTADRRATRDALFRAAAAILDDGLRTGRQAEPIGVDLAVARMDSCRPQHAESKLPIWVE